MTTLILLRHGRSSANAAGVLAGRTPGVELDESGRAQAAGLVGRLTGVPLAEVVLAALRCEQTVAPLLADRGLIAVTEQGLAEVDYGSWTNRALKDLGKEPLWRVVQAHPSAAVFPDGEGLAGMQARAVAASATTTPGSPRRTGRAPSGSRAATGCDQVDPGRRAGQPPRQLPADRRGPVLDQRGAVHRDPPVRGAGQRPGRRRRGPGPAEPKPGEDGAPENAEEASEAVVGGSTGA